MRRAVLISLTVSIAVAVLGTAACCGKKDTEEAAPSASSAVASAPPPPVASDSASASADIAKPKAPVVSNTGGEAEVKACCNALRASAAKAKAKDKTSYEAAAAVCDGLAPKVKSGAVSAAAAKTTIRAQVQKTGSIPGAMPVGGARV